MQRTGGLSLFIKLYFLYDPFNNFHFLILFQFGLVQTPFYELDVKSVDPFRNRPAIGRGNKVNANVLNLVSLHFAAPLSQGMPGNFVLCQRIQKALPFPSKREAR